MKSWFTSTGVRMRAGKAGAAAGGTRRSPYAVLRDARGWFAPLVLLAMLTFLLQPVLCWPSQLHRAGSATAVQALDTHTEGGTCAGRSEAVAEATGHAGHDATECCTTLDAVTAQAAPMQTALPLVLSAAPDLGPQTAVGNDRWNAQPGGGALDSWLRARALPYHARTARRLI